MRLTSIVLRTALSFVILETTKGGTTRWVVSTEHQEAKRVQEKPRWTWIKTARWPAVALGTSKRPSKPC